MKIFRQILLLSIIAAFVSSCSDYQKILKGDDYEAKFIEAGRQFDNKNYGKSVNLYEQIYQRFPRTDQGQVAYYRIGRSYYEEKDYYMAGYYFNQFTQRFPFSERAEDAMFMTAMCAVNNSPNYTLDQEETMLALNDLQLFVQRYPNSEFVDSCNNIMDRLRLKIETKEYESVKLYDKTGETRAAVVASKVFLEEYPQSIFVHDVTLIEFDNAYKLAMNSILSMKKDRILDAMDIYGKYKHYYEHKRSDDIRTSKMNENLKKELLLVEERYEYDEILKSFQLSNSSSKQKKMRYLEETMTRFNIFAEKYPTSEYLDKARNVYKRAEKELNNLK